MTSESQTMREILLTCSRGDTRLFRANAGKAWQGRSSFNGAVLTLQNYRAIQLMPEGFPDLIGWRSHTITEDDVGRSVAIFVAIECKAVRGKPRNQQLKFHNIIKAAGGLTGIARTVADAEEILDGR